MMILSLFRLTYQVGFYLYLQVLTQSLPHTWSLVQCIHWFQAQLNILIQVKLLSAILQYFHLQCHQRIILTILALFHLMHKVGLCLKVLVMFQTILNPRSQVHYTNWSQSQVQQLIQVNIPATNFQGCLMRSHQWSVRMIIALFHIMYQLGVYP